MKHNRYIWHRKTYESEEQPELVLEACPVFLNWSNGSCSLEAMWGLAAVGTQEIVANIAILLWQEPNLWPRVHLAECE